jgi:hypothetical protein
MTRGPEAKSSNARVSRTGLVRSRSGLPWIVLGPSLLGLACLVCACSGTSTTSGDPSAWASTSQAIYAGTPDNDANANDAIVAVKIGNMTPFRLCSGVLVGYNVVLTAWHCVAQMLSATVQCDQNGMTMGGPQLGADVPLSDVHVFTGSNPDLLMGMPAANASAFFHGTGSTLCNGDAALIVLDQNIYGIAPLRVRLVNPTMPNESLRAVGYGQNDQTMLFGARYRKDNLPILAVGSSVSASGTPLGSNELELGEAMCEGDSGGPALSETTGAAIAIVSRGGACTDAFGHVYTETAGFSALFQQAFAKAGGAVAEENGPAPMALPPPNHPQSDAGSTDAAGAPPPPDATTGPVNLRSGAGSSCATSSGPARATDGAWLLALLAVVSALRPNSRRSQRRRRAGRRASSPPASPV